MSKLLFLNILLIGFIDYFGITLVYHIFATLLFDSSYPLLPAESSAFYRGAILGILIGITPFIQFFSAPILGSISDIKGRRQILIYATLIGFISYVFAVVGIYLHSI